jgi:type II secretory pathway component GspD/PulD (secretin)
MISRNVIRKSLKTLTPSLFLLLCCSISAFAQSPAESQEPRQKDLANVTFGSSPVKAAINLVVSQMGFNVVFDETIKDDAFSIELTDVTMEQALKIIFVAKRLQARIIEEKKIIVFPDNEANHEKYRQYELWPAKSDANK